MRVYLKEKLKKLLKDVAKKYGFENVNFVEYYESGRSISRKQAQSKNPKEITYSFLSLFPLKEIYEISPEITEKVAEVVCLHERAHYKFPKPPEADEWEVQEKAAQMYGNYVEYAILDSLLLFFLCPSNVKNDKLKRDILKYINNYKKLTEEEKKKIVDGFIELKKVKKAVFFRKRKIERTLKSLLKISNSV